MEQLKKLKYGFENSPVNCVLKRLGLIDRIEPVNPPENLDDMKPKQEITDIFLVPHSPIILYAGSKGKEWLVYLRRHFKRRSPFFLHIGFPAIPDAGWLKGKKIIPPMGHLSLKVPSLHRLLVFLSDADEKRTVNEEERLLIFSLFGWEECFKSKNAIEHQLKIHTTGIIKSIEERVKEKNLQTWVQIKGEFDIKQGETDPKKIQIIGFLKTIEKHWQLKLHSRSKDHPR
jgi:hypothetical protein